MWEREWERRVHIWYFHMKPMNLPIDPKYFSIKHDLARSCFQFWLKIGDKGDKISRKKLVRLCFMLYTPSFGNSWKKWKFCNWLVRRRRPLWCQWRPLCGFGNFGKKFWIWEFFFLEIFKILNFFKILNYNFQSRKQILTLGGVYCPRINKQLI